jgi:hypothetical protein
MYDVLNKFCVQCYKDNNFYLDHEIFNQFSHNLFTISTASKIQIIDIKILI